MLPQWPQVFAALENILVTCLNYEPEIIFSNHSYIRLVRYALNGLVTLFLISIFTGCITTLIFSWTLNLQLATLGLDLPHCRVMGIPWKIHFLHGYSFDQQENATEMYSNCINRLSDHLRLAPYLNSLTFALFQKVLRGQFFKICYSYHVC